MLLKTLLENNCNSTFTEVHLGLADGWKEYGVYYKDDVPMQYLSYRVLTWWFDERLNVAIQKQTEK